MPSLTERRLTPERMDAPDADPRDLERSLRFLRFVNARLGGTRASMKPFRKWSRQWSPGKTIRVLDIGTGSADIPIAMIDWANSHNFAMQVTAIDKHPTTLDIARRYIGSRDDVVLIECDALALMDRFEPGSFDYAHTGTFLHHLTDVEVMTVLRSMDRLSRHGVVWNDLLRTRFARSGAQMLRIVPGVPAMVRHDAVVSFEAGFTRHEAIELARRVGLAEIECRTHLLYRFTLSATKQARVTARDSPPCTEDV